jgi:hypothetical protein
MVRYRLMIPLLALAIAVVVPASLQASVGAPQAGPAADAGALERADIAQRGKKGKGKKRPGCRRFCQQAGGFGDNCDENTQDCDPVEIPAQTVDGTRDRIVALRATCELERECKGAIILTSLEGGFEYGRADLRIPAGESRKVKVGISRKGLDYLKEHGKDKTAFATVPLVYKDVPVSISGDLTLLAP